MFENLTITVNPGHPPRYSSEEIVHLTGIIGIHPDLSKHDDINIEISPFVDCTRVVVSSAAIKYLLFVIYYSFNCIDNLNIRATHLRSGIASKWVLSQSTAATAQRLKHLEAYAFREGTTAEWSGYIVWGKLGYLMHGDSLGEFENLMNDKGRSEKSLEELISHTEGLEFWIAEGFPWQGRFDLAIGSESEWMLKNYIERKNKQS